MPRSFDSGFVGATDYLIAECDPGGTPTGRYLLSDARLVEDPTQAWQCDTRDEAAANMAMFPPPAGKTWRIVRLDYRAVITTLDD